MSDYFFSLVELMFLEHDPFHNLKAKLGSLILVRYGHSIFTRDGTMDIFDWEEAISNEENQ